MVKAEPVFRAVLLVLPFAVAVLVLAALARGAEYDEQYTLFLTGQVPRPDWGDAPFPAATAWALQHPTFDPAGIARALRETDVHPPLYFWLAGIWRSVLGADLFTLRLLSVACSLGALALVGVLAHRHGVRPGLAMLLTLGSYGFVYTGIIARGFALATLLTLAGAVLLTRDKRPLGLSAGLAFGAACCANYLAVFAALGYLAGRVLAGATRVRGLALVGLGIAPFLTLDLWFFLAQRNARPDQFPPFDLLATLPRLARLSVANLFGGLPLYAPAPWSEVITVVLAGAALWLVSITAWTLRANPRPSLPLLGATLGPPIGLLGLGMLFNNTPIELRYLAFSVPFATVLLARAPTIVLALVYAVQAVALGGLMLGRETMQPARETARAAASLAQGDLVLLPSGNDGVGIVGAFARESPADLRLLVVRPTEDAAAIRRRIGDERRVVIAAMAQDDASRTTIPVMQQAVTGPCWRPAGTGFNVAAFDRAC